MEKAGIIREALKSAAADVREVRDGLFTRAHGVHDSQLSAAAARLDNTLEQIRLARESLSALRRANRTPKPLAKWSKGQAAATANYKGPSHPGGHA